MKASCPKRCVNMITAPIFAAALCGNREYLVGGGVWGSSFLNSLHAHIRIRTKGESVQKESLLLAHSCEERYSRQAAEGQKAQFGLGFTALMPHGAHSLNCCIEKG